MAGRGDARRAVHVHTHVALVRKERLSRVQAHAHADGPRCKRIVGFRYRCERVGRLGKGDEERIPLGIHLDAAVARERLAQHPAVLGEDVRVIIPELLQQPRRSFHVRKQEGDCPGRQVGHADMMRRSCEKV